MNNATLKRELKKELNKYMKDTEEYIPSRRIEGMLEKSGDQTMPEKAAILVDNELDNDIFRAMATFVKEILQGDSNFKKIKLLTHIWKQGKIEKKPCGNIDFIRVSKLQDVIDSLELDDGPSGDWDNLKENINTIKKAPLVLFFTTEEKIEKLTNSMFSSKNMIIIYPSNKVEATSKKIRNIPCLMYSLV